MNMKWFMYLLLIDLCLQKTWSINFDIYKSTSGDWRVTAYEIYKKGYCQLGKYFVTCQK